MALLLYVDTTRRKWARPRWISCSLKMTIPRNSRAWCLLKKMSFNNWPMVWSTSTHCNWFMATSDQRMFTFSFLLTVQHLRWSNGLVSPCLNNWTNSADAHWPKWRAVWFGWRQNCWNFTSLQSSRPAQLLLFGRGFKELTCLPQALRCSTISLEAFTPYCLWVRTDFEVNVQKRSIYFTFLTYFFSKTFRHTGTI